MNKNNLSFFVKSVFFALIFTVALYSGQKSNLYSTKFDNTIKYSAEKSGDGKKENEKEKKDSSKKEDSSKNDSTCKKCDDSCKKDGSCKNCDDACKKGGTCKKCDDSSKKDSTDKKNDDKKDTCKKESEKKDCDSTKTKKNCDCVAKSDTVIKIVKEKIHDTITVTKEIIITNTVLVHDTIVVKEILHDTITVTKEVFIHDTTFVDKIVYIHDTTKVKENVYIHDTTVVEKPVYIHDTTFVDKNIYVHDTTVVENTITVHDTLTTTVYKTDTLYIPCDTTNGNNPTKGLINQGSNNSNYTPSNNLIMYNNIELALIKETYPNPTNSNSQLDLTMYDQANVSIRLYNQLGQIKSIVYNGILEKGDHSINISKEDLSDGLNIVEINIMGSKILKRIIRNK